MTDTLILGLGNPLRGDDGVGPAVIDWLHEHDLPPGVSVWEGSVAGPDLTLTLAEYRRVIVVDAADVGRSPGAWMRFRPESVRLKNGPSAVSLHTSGLADALALGTALGMLPDEIVIYGIQPARLDWHPGLSAEAQAAVPAVGRAVLREIGGQDGKDSDHR